jgi:hypothetical protein
MALLQDSTQSWKNNFQRTAILRVRKMLSGGDGVARLLPGERERRLNIVLRRLKYFRWGIREGELSQELGWPRRTVNNYLRELKEEGKAYREGRSWFAR